VGRDTYHGDGKQLEGGILTVHWGTDTVVYALIGNNELKGLWSGVSGGETLSLEE
jgi:hypothetical protein